MGKLDETRLQEVRYLGVFLWVFVFVFFLSFCPFRATLEAHGGSQARGLIGTVAAGLRQSHSNAKSEPQLRTTP